MSLRNDAIRTATLDDVTRFLALVDRRGECWDWRGLVHRLGYGVFPIGRHVYAHRFAYFIATDVHPEELHVLHACDRPLCVNPSHLSLGTHADNMRDKMARGRHRPVKGSRQGGAKLTEADIPEIRRLRAEGSSASAVARQFGVSVSTISLIDRKRHWAHVP